MAIKGILSMRQRAYRKHEIAIQFCVLFVSPCHLINFIVCICIRFSFFSIFSITWIAIPSKSSSSSKSEIYCLYDIRSA